MLSRLLVRSAVATAVCCTQVVTTSCSSSSSREEGYDFAIVGLGASGSTALETLLTELERRNITNKRIVVMDSTVSDGASRRRGTMVTLVNGTVTRLSTRDRTLLLDSSSGTSKVSFKKLLISTGQGSVGLADNPFVDASSGDRVFSAANPLARYALAERARRREHVTFVGANSWAVLDLMHDFVQESRAVGTRGSATLLFPGYGVLSSMLPRHLSIAVSRRLQALGLELVPYQQLQYVSEKSAGALEVYTNKTYDSLHTGRYNTHAICLAGQALFPSGASGLRHFVERAGLEVHPEGGLLLNPNLQSRCGIYAAGDISSVPTSQGRFVFTGRGHAEQSGRVAALNMVHSSLGEPSVEYALVPSSSYNLDLWGLYFTAVGTCTSSVDMHTFQWRAVSASSRRAASGRKSAGADGPQGLLRLARLPSNSNRDGRPQPLGLSVTFYTDGGVVIGVMVMGVPGREGDSAVAAAATKCIGVNIGALAGGLEVFTDNDDDDDDDDDEPVHVGFEVERLLTAQRMAAMASSVVAPAVALPAGQPLPRPTYLFSHPSRMNSSRNIENERLFNSGNTGSVKSNLTQAYKTGASRASF